MLDIKPENRYYMSKAGDNSGGKLFQNRDYKQYEQWGKQYLKNTFAAAKR